MFVDRQTLTASQAKKNSKRHGNLIYNKYGN